MSFRLRKSVKVVPGVRLNLSKSGASVSLGARGATVNIGKKGVRTSVGIPGTGLSWSKQNGWNSSKPTSKREEIFGLVTYATDSTKVIQKAGDNANASIARVNKAIDTLNGGRGPTDSKTVTFKKRIHSEAKKIQELRQSVLDEVDLFDAVEQRLNSMRFGIFGGSAKKLRDEGVRIVSETKKSSEAVLRDIEKVSSKLGEIIADLEAEC